MIPKGQVVVNLPQMVWDGGQYFLQYYEYWAVWDFLLDDPELNDEPVRRLVYMELTQ